MGYEVSWGWWFWSREWLQPPLQHLGVLSLSYMRWFLLFVIVVSDILLIVLLLLFKRNFSSSNFKCRGRRNWTEVFFIMCLQLILLYVFAIAACIKAGVLWNDPKWNVVFQAIPNLLLYETCSILIETKLGQWDLPNVPFGHNHWGVHAARSGSWAKTGKFLIWSEPLFFWSYIKHFFFVMLNQDNCLWILGRNTSPFSFRECVVRVPVSLCVFAFATVRNCQLSPTLRNCDLHRCTGRKSDISSETFLGIAKQGRDTSSFVPLALQAQWFYLTCFCVHFAWQGQCFVEACGFCVAGASCHVMTAVSRFIWVVCACRQSHKIIAVRPCLVWLGACEFSRAVT